jgi:hypothetical protein
MRIIVKYEVKDRAAIGEDERDTAEVIYNFIVYFNK